MSWENSNTVDDDRMDFNTSSVSQRRHPIEHAFNFVVVCLSSLCGETNYKRRRVILNLVISVLLNLHKYFLISSADTNRGLSHTQTQSHRRTHGASTHIAQYPYFVIWQLLNFDFEICRADGGHRPNTGCRIENCVSGINA